MIFHGFVYVVFEIQSNQLLIEMESGLSHPEANVTEEERLYKPRGTPIPAESNCLVQEKCNNFLCQSPDEDPTLTKIGVKSTCFTTQLNLTVIKNCHFGARVLKYGNFNLALCT